MISYLRARYWIGPIGLILAAVILTVSGCGSSPPKQTGPAADADLERFNRAGRLAFDKGRLQQAASFYRKALERAYVRDDTAAILDAQYNLAICLMNLQAYEEALEVVLQADSETVIAGDDRSFDLLFLEATLRYHNRDLDEAWKISEQILSAAPPASSVIQSKTHYLRGLIANHQGDLGQLRAAIASLGQPQQPQLRADRQELAGHLAMAERHWDVAMKAFDSAVRLRRETLDYREMVNVLALAGSAGEKAGRAREASIRYLRAGRSALLQGMFDKARKWLLRAEQTAGTAGDTQIVAESRIYLGQLQELSEALPSGSAQ